MTSAGLYSSRGAWGVRTAPAPGWIRSASAQAYNSRLHHSDFRGGRGRVTGGTRAWSPTRLRGGRGRELHCLEAWAGFHRALAEPASQRGSPPSFVRLVVGRREFGRSRGMIELTAHRLRGSATHSPVLWAVPWATSVVFAGGSAAADSLRMRICRMGWLSIAPSWASASAHVRRSRERLCFSCLRPAKGRPGSHFRDHELAGRGDSANRPTEMGLASSGPAHRFATLML
jgi:hypothetical protein